MLASPWVSRSEPHLPHLQVGETNPHLIEFSGLNERIWACSLRTVECSTNAVHRHALPSLITGDEQQTGEGEWEAALNQREAQFLVRQVGRGQQGGWEDVG